MSSCRQLARIREICAALDSRPHRPVTSRSLAETLEVSQRTVKRDIETLRDALSAPIEWDAGRRSYRLAAPYNLMEHARLTAEEGLALVLASKAFAAWGSTQLSRALEAALVKVTDVVSKHASFPLGDIAHLISAPPIRDARSEGLHWFSSLLAAIRERCVVEIGYKKPSQGREERRRLRPLHLALLERRWVLVAYDPARRGIRKFVLARIQGIETKKESFESPPGFDAKAYLRGSFGHFTGEEEIGVAVRFSPDLAPYVAEQRWHPSQAGEPQADGALVLRFTLNSLEDVQRWILSWGARAEALEPEELRAAVAAELEGAAGRYEGRTKNEERRREKGEGRVKKGERRAKKYEGEGSWGEG